MIKCQLDSLPIAQEKELRDWLEKPALALLVKVAEGQLKFQQSAALKDAITAKDYENYFGRANEAMREAQRYATFLEIMDRLVKQKEPFTTARLS